MEGTRRPRSHEGNKNQKALNSCIESNDDILLNRKKKFDIMYTNADSLSNKQEVLKLFLSDKSIRYKVIIITEVNPKNSLTSVLESEFNMTGFNIYSCNIGKNKCRGIIAYVSSELSCSELSVETNFSECLLLRITGINPCPLVIGAVYRSQGTK